MAEAARRAGVAVVGGGTKVVEHGKADGLYIITAGIGVVDPRLTTLSVKRVQSGDQVLLSGPIGDHGITVLLAQGEFDQEADLVFGYEGGVALGGGGDRGGCSGVAMDAGSQAGRGSHCHERIGPEGGDGRGVGRRGDFGASGDARGV